MVPDLSFNKYINTIFNSTQNHAVCWGRFYKVLVYDQFPENYKILVGKVRVTLKTHARVKSERLRETYAQLLLTQNC